MMEILSLRALRLSIAQTLFSAGGPVNNEICACH